MVNFHPEWGADFTGIRNIADAFLETVGINKSSKLPLDIEILANKRGIKVIPIMNLKKDFDIRGVVIKKPAGFDIGIDYDHYMEGRQELYYRFTIAEELAHILVHSDYFDLAKCWQDSAKILGTMDDEEYGKLEGQAKAVANCLLLPHFLFDDYVIEYVKTNEAEIKKSYYYDKADLSNQLAIKLSAKLGLSVAVVRIVILKRWPDLLIDKIIVLFGSDLIG